MRVKLVKVEGVKEWKVEKILNKKNKWCNQVLSIMEEVYNRTCIRIAKNRLYLFYFILFYFHFELGLGFSMMPQVIWWVTYHMTYHSYGT